MADDTLEDLFGGEEEVMVVERSFVIAFEWWRTRDRIDTSAGSKHTQTPLLPPLVVVLFHTRTEDFPADCEPTATMLGSATSEPRPPVISKASWIFAIIGTSSLLRFADSEEVEEAIVMRV